MHFNSSLFTNFREQSSVESDPICLVLTDFPSNIDLIKTKSQIEEEFSFITKIHIRLDSEIQCYFESMTDLVELDQGIKYGAGRAFIRHLTSAESQNDEQSNFQKAKGVFLNSKQTFASDSQNIHGSYKFIPSMKGEFSQICQIDPKLLHQPKLQRLTSLQNEIEQLEHIREQLQLIKEDSDQDRTFETDQLHEMDDHYTWGKKNHSNQIHNHSIIRNDQNSNDEVGDQDQETVQNSQINRRQLVMSLLEGAALTGLIFGGVKLFKNLLK